MSFDQDSISGPSLRDLVVETLQINGVLGKIQAELKASVYLTLEEDIEQREIPLVDKKTIEIFGSSMGKLTLSIIKDFFTSFGLDFTSSVFESEANISSIDAFPQRETLIEKLNLHKDEDNEQHEPVLFKLIRSYQNNSEKNSITSSASDMNNAKSELTNGNKLKLNEELLINLNISNESLQEESAQKSPLTEDINQNYSSEHRDEISSQKDTNDQQSSPSLGSQIAYEDECIWNTETEQKDSENVDISETVEEMIEEDLSFTGVISSISEMTDTTKDFTASEKADVCDYHENL